jgi:hypothetical protein
VGRTTISFTLLLDAGKVAGEVRPDVDADEVLLLAGRRAHATCSAWSWTACAAATGGGRGSGSGGIRAALVLPA